MNQWSNREKVIVGCCAAAAVLCFLPWWSISMQMMAGMSVSINAFDRTEGVFAFLLTIATGALVFADCSGMLPWKEPVRRLVTLATAAGATLFMVVFIGRGSGAPAQFKQMMSGGRTMWSFLAAIAMGLATFQAFGRWQASANPAAENSDASNPT